MKNVTATFNTTPYRSIRRRLHLVFFGITSFILIISSLLAIHNTWIFTTTAQASPVSCHNPVSLPYPWMSIRLYAQKECASASGIVEDIGKSDDGDVDFLLKPDPPYRDVINTVNRTRWHGDLIVEIVCDGNVTSIFAIGGCGTYKNKLPLPKIGDHVYVTGALVEDTVHGGWMEIHPVYSIKKLH